MIRDKMGANTEEEKGRANLKLLEFRGKLKYDAIYAKTETEKGYAVEMLTELDLLEIKMENMYELEKTPSMQSGHLQKFHKICQKVVDAKTEWEKGCADVELLHFTPLHI